MEFPTLKYPPIRLRARHGEGGRVEVLDKVRGRWLVLTPEEWVRRHVVEYMTTECGYPTRQLVEEYPVNLNNMSQRADIVALNRDGSPYVVVECKEPGVRLGEEVLRQAVRYNSVLRAQYIVLTNGIDTACYTLNSDGSYAPTPHFPRYEER